MKIDDSNGTAGVASGRASSIEQAHGPHGKSSAFRSVHAGGDSLALSGPFLAIQNFNQARSARLEQLANAVQNGSYALNAAAVSNALINETLASQRS